MLAAEAVAMPRHAGVLRAPHAAGAARGCMLQTRHECPTRCRTVYVRRPTMTRMVLLWALRAWRGHSNEAGRMEGDGVEPLLRLPRCVFARWPSEVLRRV